MPHAFIVGWKGSYELIFLDSEGKGKEKWHKQEISIFLSPTTYTGF